MHSLLNFADWQRHQGAFDHEKFESDIQLLVDCIIASLSTLPRLILLICPSRPSAAAAAYTAAAERLDALAHEHPRLSVLSPTALAAWYPVAEPHDIVGETLGLPYTEQLFCAIGGASARGLLPCWRRLAPGFARQLPSIATLRCGMAQSVRSVQPPSSSSRAMSSFRATARSTAAWRLDHTALEMSRLTCGAPCAGA